MTKPPTPAQTPGQTWPKTIVGVALPLAIFLVIADSAWGNFTVFGARSKHAEPKSVLRCLSRREPTFTWTGGLDALALKAASKSDCITVIFSRYQFIRAQAATPALFVAFPQEPRRSELGDDVWAVEAGAEPVHCFDPIVPGRILLPTPRPTPDSSPVCEKAFALLGVDATELEPRR